MSTVKAYYDGAVFVPFGELGIPKGKVVRLSVEQDDVSSQANVEKLEAFRRLTDEIRELNKTEPLPQMFDDILAQRTNFTRELGL